MARSNATQVAADLAVLATETRAAVHAVVVSYGAILNSGVQRNASGRPGPNVVTGNYRRSITRRTELRATTSTATVGTNAPEGRRLELGFSGVDAIGRRYNQPPFFHFSPALDEVAVPFTAAVQAAATPGRGRS